MRYWTDQGHPTDLALEHWASEELEARELQALSDHLRTCPGCRAAAEEWRQLFEALAALPRPEPAPGFDDAVMARVHLGAPRAARPSARLAELWRRARVAALGAAAAWTATVIGAGVWAAARVEASPAMLIAAGLESARELLWTTVVRVAAILHLSGAIETLNDAAQAIPGPGVLSAVAAMTAISAAALWTLYRTAELKNPRLKAHV